MINDARINPQKNGLLQLLPYDILNHILEFDGRFNYDVVHNHFVGKIMKDDPRYNMLLKHYQKMTRHEIGNHYLHANYTENTVATLIAYKNQDDFYKMNITYYNEKNVDYLIAYHTYCKDYITIGLCYINGIVHHYVIPYTHSNANIPFYYSNNISNICMDYILSVDSC